jgi:hypothetical protein
MYVIRLPNGNLLVPQSAASDDGAVIGDAYVEIGPDDVDYERLAAQALTQEEFDERRRQWQEGDDTLRRQFLDFLAHHGHPGRGEDHAAAHQWAQPAQQDRRGAQQRAPDWRGDS